MLEGIRRAHIFQEEIIDLKLQESSSDRVLDAHRGMSNRHLLILLLSLGAIAGSLFTIFIFISTMTFGRATGLALFLLVTALLIAGYMLAFMLLAFLAILLLTRYWQKSRK